MNRAIKPSVKTNQPISNPFASRFVKPGELPYLFESGEDLLDSVLKKFEQKKCVGQIVGPHGSGKSTLVRAMEDFGWMFDNSRYVTIRSVKDIKAIGDLSAELEDTMMIVDGLERLSWLHRFLAVDFLRSKAAGLLITTHRRIIGLPVIYKTKSNLELFRLLVSRLQPGELLDDETISDCYRNHAPDMREALMELYDRWESRKT